MPDSAKLPLSPVSQIVALRDRYQRQCEDAGLHEKSWFEGGIETCNRILTMLDDAEQPEDVVFSEDFIGRFRAALHVRASNLFWKREKDEQIIREALQDAWDGDSAKQAQDDAREIALRLWGEMVVFGWSRPDDALKDAFDFTSEEQKRAIDDAKEVKRQEDERERHRFEEASSQGFPDA